MGQSDTLTITTMNASSCTLSGPTNSGSVPCNGSFSVTPNATGLATYTVTATGLGGPLREIGGYGNTGAMSPTS
jgi:Tfp pilus assembly protein PilX